MHSPSEIRRLFESTGGQFISSPELIAEKLHKIKAFVFDWDGVFNEGEKGGGHSSGFSEVDSMGTNMLRFATWLSFGKHMPLLSVITGADNIVASEFATREKFDKLYFKVRDKSRALDHLLVSAGLKPDEVAFFFDDILDLSISQRCGLRIFINSPGKVLFNEYMRQDRVDYVTGNSGGNHGVREACELLIGLMTNYDHIIERRYKFDAQYEAYWNLRQSNLTGFYTLSDNGIIIEHHVE